MKQRFQGSANTGAKAGAIAGAILALLAGTAVPARAQSNVNFYGSLDLAAYSKQLAGETRLKTLTSGIMNASRFGWSGNEDLGGGLKARFDLSSFVRMDTGQVGRSDSDGFFQRYAWVGLEGGFGLARAGRISTPNFLNTIRFNPYADSSLAPVFMHTYIASGAQPMMTSHGTTDSAWSNALAYNSPTLGGAQLALLVAAGEGGTAGRRVGGSLSWGAGPFAVGLSVEDLSRMSLNFSKPPTSILATDAKTLNLGLSYDFGAVKLFAQAQDAKSSNASIEIRLKTAQLGATVPLGAGRVLASFAKTEKTQTAALDTTRQTTSLGYDYNLSKRTDVYAVLTRDQVSRLSNGTGYAFGLRHNF